MRFSFFNLTQADQIFLFGVGLKVPRTYNNSPLLISIVFLEFNSVDQMLIARLASIEVLDSLGRFEYHILLSNRFIAILYFASQLGLLWIMVKVAAANK